MDLSSHYLLEVERVGAPYRIIWTRDEGCVDRPIITPKKRSITLKLWLDHLGLELPPASTLSDNLNAVSNQTRGRIQQAQLCFILQQGLDDFQKCFIDSTAVEANTDRPTDSTILVKLIARVCTTGGNLHRLDLPDMNQIGLLEQHEELRRMSQQIHFLNGKARGEAKRKKNVFPVTAARAQTAQTSAA